MKTREQINEYYRKRRAANPERARARDRKYRATRSEIEAQFLPGMSWDNYGRRGWELDHRRPCASFDMTDHTQVLVCFHWTNLRPLWRTDNLRRPKRGDDV